MLDTVPRTSYSLIESSQPSKVDTIMETIFFFFKGEAPGS